MSDDEPTTPETDAVSAELQCRADATSAYFEMRDHARKLERERDEARASIEGGVVGSQSGLRIREYFAARALQGILSNPDRLYNPDDAAREAVIHADSLIYILGQNTQTHPSPKEDQPES